MKIKRIAPGFYEMRKEGKVLYTISEGGKGWNVYSGDDVLKGHIDSFDTLKECKEECQQWNKDQEQGEN